MLVNRAAGLEVDVEREHGCTVAVSTEIARGICSLEDTWVVSKRIDENGEAIFSAKVIFRDREGICRTSGAGTRRDPEVEHDGTSCLEIKAQKRKQSFRTQK